MSLASRPYFDVGTRYLVGAACLVVIVAGLRAAAQLVLPFLVAVCLAVVSVPFMRWLQHRRVPRALAVFCTILSAGAVVGLLGLIVGRAVNEFTIEVPRYQYRLQGLIESVMVLADDIGLPTEEWSAFNLFPVGIFDLLGGTLGAIASFTSNTFLVLLTVVFILVEATGFSSKLRLALGKETHFGQLEQMIRQVQNYLVIKTLISAGTGIVVGLCLAVIGLDFALLLGLIVFVLNFIPTLGSIIAAVPAVLLALVQFDFATASLVALVYVGVNLVCGTVIEPILMGRRLGLSTLVIFVSLVFWGWVWGPIGMLFSVPLTMVVKIALENTKDLRWVAVMLDADPSATPAQTRAES